jgi:methylenetetrahydrofolate dehydrogenase (NADP+)/methenyltetrahydrofolate cyclohydrolase
MKIDGQRLSKVLLNNLSALIKQNILRPTLAILQVANLSQSSLYVKQKKRVGDRVGIKVIQDYFPKSTKEGEIIKRIEQYNKDEKVNAIIVQLPLPKNLDTDKIISKIKPEKDVDGFLPNSPFTPPVSLAVLATFSAILNYQQNMVRSYHVFAISKREKLANLLKTKKIVIIGRGKTGGEPVLRALKSLGIPNTLIHSKTKSPEKITKKADIIISCVGKSEIVKPENIKKGVILISVGIHRERNGKLRGDYNEEAIKNTASYYTPTPGGVGPLTVAFLMKNVIQASNILV